MFVSQAHSFKQQARLAVTLAWVGGYTNILTILACGTVTSHVSGTTSNLGHDLFTGNWSPAGMAAFLLVTFFIGAAISGFVTEFGRRNNWQSIYILPMIIEFLLLIAFALILERFGHPTATGIPPHLLAGIAAAAMGLQNATITQISSGVVRTTHVTGVLTDLGSESARLLSHIIRRRRKLATASPRTMATALTNHPTARRLLLLASIFSSFALGAGLGTLAYSHFPRLAMYPPCAFLLWIIFQDITAPIAKIEPSTLAGMNLPPSIAIFHLRQDRDRKGRTQRIPNLLSWADRLPPTTRIVVLDLAEVTHIDDNALGEFRALFANFKTKNRTLILAGINEQFARLQSAGDLLTPENACQDLDLAIARALNLT